MYINKQLKADELKIVSNYQENVWIKLKLKGSDELLVGCIYKSPNSDKENLSLLNKMIIEASQMKQFSHLLIMGDFTTKANKHNYLPLDERTIQEIKHKHRCWTRYMENRDPPKYK